METYLASALNFFAARGQRRLQVLIWILVAVSFPGLVWGKDKGWENRPIATFGTDQKFDKHKPIDGYMSFALIEVVDGKVLIRVTKDHPERREQGVIVALAENVATPEPIRVSGVDGKTLCTIELRKQTTSKTSHVGTGQFGSASTVVESRLHISSQPAESSSP